MALNGTINGSVTNNSNYFSFYLTWSATQSVSGNYSDVTVTTCWSTNNMYQGFDTVGTRSASITINGVTSSISKAFNVCASGSTSWATNPYVIQTATQRVYHNNDGTKSITISARANGYASSYGPSSSTASSADCTASGTITLNTIPRASSVSISTTKLNVGSSITATISRASSSFTHTVEFYINSTYYQKYTNVATSQAYTIPTSWYSAMPSSTSCTAYCRVTTYNGSTQIGSQVTKSFTVCVPSNIIPSVGSITLDPADINGNNILVQNKNKLTISVSGCSAGTGSSIKSYTFSGPGISSTTTSTSTTSSSAISNTGTLTYTVKVTDARGRVASKTATITCYAYTAPYIKPFSAYRCNSGGTADENGSYVKCDYTLGYSSVNSTNNVTVKIMYKKNTASSYSSVTSLSNSTNKSGSQLLSSIDTSSTYTIYATITDKYGGSSQSSYETVFSLSRIINITSDGTGVALGKMAESKNALDVKWQIKTDEPEQTMQNLSYRGANLVSSTTNDTTTQWGSHKNLTTTFYTTTGQITDQPAQYGFLLNLTNGDKEVHQLWATQSSGSLLHRGGNASGWNGSWRTVFDSSNYTNYVSKKPTQLYSTSSGSSGTITLSSSVANFSYLEIYYTDNNSKQPNSVRIFSPDGKYVSLSCIEPSTNGTEPRVYIRSSGWTISGTTMTPGRSDLSGENAGVYGHFYPNAGGTNVDVKVTENNYIKIFRVLGYS